MTTREPRSDTGFTLIEIVVVMGVIAVLVGVAVMIVGAALRQTRVHETCAVLSRVSTSIDDLDRSLGALPPDRASELEALYGIRAPRVVPANRTNEGNEVALQSIYLPDSDSRLLLEPEELANADDDRFARRIGRLARELVEVADAWGRPLVFVSARSYGRFDDDPAVYVADDGREFPVRPWRTDDGMFAQPTTFQLFSVGADGVPNTSDDLKAWELNS